MAKLGDEPAARLLCYEYGGRQIILPQRLFPDDELIRRLASQNLKPSEIARHVRRSDSYVYRVLRQMSQGESRRES